MTRARGSIARGVDEGAAAAETIGPCAMTDVWPAIVVVVIAVDFARVLAVRDGSVVIDL